ncbi:putative glutathione S-transferase 9 [Ditylenchus destructor]|uniref:glutathione transferase n=1 Tax=Ditylenchus destructor TaxID=166010 RepID=A0AAD4RAN6_9BILA|nr:putative glutathione S-transferase 9 [Ditylenchus destructor]
MVHYKLTYFQVRGLGESIRLILTHSGQKWEEVNPDFQGWQGSPLKEKTPFGKLPVLEVDGKPLAETFAICRYLSKKYGLAGKDDWEQAKVDEIADFHKDVALEIGPFFRVFFGFAPGDKDKMHKEVFLPAVEKYFPTYVRALKESGSGFLTKGGLTWPDFLVAEFLTTINNIDSTILKKYPELEQYRQRVHSQPTIKSYVAGRKHSVV